MLEDSPSIRLERQLRAWLASTPLFNETTFDGIHLFSQNQLQLPLDQISLKAFEIPNKLVLGKRIERLFSYCIDQSDQYELIFENLQIIENQHTLGELDFMLKEIQTDTYIHVELVHKFYLFDPDLRLNGKEKWIGPNRNDSLNKKLSKLEDKQFPLLGHSTTQKRLSTFGINSEEVRQRLCFNASLFLPVNGEVQFDDDLNPDCIAGSWLKFNELQNLKYQYDQFYIPLKEDWLIEPHNEVNWISYNAFIESLKVHLSKKISPMCWIKSGGELKRFFTVWW